MEERALAAEIGQALKRFREAHTLRQDDVARAARHVGLPWTRSVVVALEAGRRYLTIDEFVRLPRVLELLGAPSVESEARLDIHGSVVHLEAATLGLRPLDQTIEVMVPMHEDQAKRLAAYRAAGGDLEQKVARRSRLDPLVVALVALTTWGRSLTEERDRRVTEQRPPGSPPRALQALRGHVTRALLEEVEPRLAEARQHLRRKKKGGPR